jgi:hypothetical protein
MIANGKIENNTLIIPAKNDEENIDIRMFCHNQISGYLSFVVEHIDDEVFYQYELRDVVSLESILHEKKLDQKMLYAIYRGILQVIESGHAFFLKESNICLMEDLIYWNPFEKKVVLLYYPEYSEDFTRQMIHLTEYFMQKVDHSDKSAMHFIYEIDHILQGEGFLYSHIASLLKKYMSDYEQFDGSCVSDCDRLMADGNRCKEVFTERTVFNDGKSEDPSVLAQSKYTSNYHASQTTSGSYFSEKNAHSKEYESKETNHQKAIPGSPDASSTNFASDLSNHRKMEKKRDAIKNPPFFSLRKKRKFFEKKEKDISISHQKIEWMLGRDPKSDIYIHNDKISWQHVKFFWRGAQLYIQDMKSSNGTFLNQKRLHEEPVLCHAKDIIRIADIEYFLIDCSLFHDLL